jgi:hypothetical protein
LTPSQVRALATRIEKAALKLEDVLNEIPGEAYQVCGHVVIADANGTRSAYRAANALRDKAGQFGNPKRTSA